MPDVEGKDCDNCMFMAMIDTVVGVGTRLQCYNSLCRMRQEAIN
jgi:hypothetical protein